MSFELKQLLEWAREYAPEERDERIVDATFKTLATNNTGLTRDVVAEEWRRLRG